MSQSPLSSQLDAERTAILGHAAASVLAVESQRVRQSAFVWRGGLLVTAAEPLEGADAVRVHDVRASVDALAPLTSFRWQCLCLSGSGPERRSRLWCH